MSRLPRFDKRTERLLRRDIASMVEVVKETLFKTFGKEAIAGIYFKGSAASHWKTVIDYVPEVSDIDIHVLLKDDFSYDKHFCDARRAMTFSTDLERRFLKKVKKPNHMPLVQLLSLNSMQQEKEYVPGFEQEVIVVYGDKYPGFNEQHKGIDFKERGRKQVLEHEAVLLTIRKRALYRYGPNLEKWIRELSWRMASIGRNYLCMNGHAFEKAWTTTKTDVCNVLEKEQKSVAKDYAAFYLQSVKYHATKEPKHARLAIIAGYDFIEACVAEAKK